MSPDQEIDNVLDTIYNENPSYWPYGLSRQHFDGGCYLVKGASSGKTLGFTGWQIRKRGRVKVGYYSIGILPEHRRKGYAKQAVSQLVAEKRASVDVVEALVKETNDPSIALAASLSIPSIKMARLQNFTRVPAATLSNPLAKTVNWGIGTITNPLQRAGSNFGAAGLKLNRGNLWGGSKQVGAGAMNVGRSALNAAMFGYGGTALKAGQGFLSAPTIGGRMGHLWRMIPDVNPMLGRLQLTRNGATLGQRSMNFANGISNPWLRRPAKAVGMFGPETAWDAGRADGMVNTNRLAQRVGKYKPTFLQQNVAPYANMVQGLGLF